MIAPLSISRTAHGSMWPSCSPASASAMYFAVSLGDGTDVNQSSHSLPSLAASVSAPACSGVSGSRRMPCPSSVIGFGAIMSGASGRTVYSSSVVRHDEQRRAVEVVDRAQTVRVVVLRHVDDLLLRRHAR